MEKSQIIHIKLNKLLYGNNQHIFKTTMNVTALSGNSKLSTSIQDVKINLKNSYNTILYSNFIPGIGTNNYELFDYDEVNFIYNLNVNYTQILGTYLNNISEFYKNYFYKYANHDQDKQNIYYFKQITTPIDVININNTGYFLSPLQTIKNVEILEQNSLIEYKNTVVKATNKPYYKNMYDYTINRAANFSENNTIPIYDLEFNFLDTINLNTYENLINWINSYRI